ncbi:MAG: DUF2807 domain-containing protein [Bacteroidales bacterium]|nr:DUF2807 domain-containing protein [Bacteroidales bacterium]
MKKLMLALVAISLLFSCKFVSVRGSEPGTTVIEASGDNLTKTFDVKDFNSVEVACALDIEYVQSSTPLFEVTGPSNLIQFLDVVQDGQNLRVKMGRDKVSLRGIKSFKARVSSSSLENIEIKGAGDFKCNGLDTPTLRVSVAGAGDLILDKLSTKDARIVINGAGDLSMNGVKCSSLNITVNGAGDLDVHDLACSGAVRAAIHGAGEVALSGEAGTAELSVSGVGSIDAKHLNCSDISTSMNGVGKIVR